METIALDIDPNGWTFFEQMDFRKAVGVNPLYAVMKIGEVFDSGDDAELANVPPEYLLGLAWIQARRDEPGLTFTAMAERYDYGAMLAAVAEAAVALADQAVDPTPAPNRAARRAGKSTRSGTTSRQRKTSSASASPTKDGPDATS